MKSIKKFFLFLIGEAEEFSLEHRLYNVVLIFGIFIFTLGLITNILIQETPTVIVSTFIGDVVLLFFYWLSRGKRLFTVPAILTFSLVLFVFTPILWFKDGGVFGGYSYYLILYGIMVFLVFKGFLRRLFISLLGVITSVLVYIQWKFPHLISYCTSENCLFYNHLVSTYIVGISIIVLFMIFANRYERAQQEVEKYNKKLIEINKQLEELSRKDPLTGLSNRRDILEKINYQVRLFKRTKEPFALILADLDDFKQVNDAFGHACGDMVLKDLAGKMVKMLREQDTVARWGGEEFLILLPRTNRNEARETAERLRRAISETEFECEGNKVRLSMSFGITVYDYSEDNIDVYLRKADEALYRCKAKGKNKVCCTEED